MFSPRPKARSLVSLGGSLGLALLAAWLAAGYQRGPPTLEQDVLPQTFHLKSKSFKDFPLRKVTPPLEEALQKSGAFASRIDIAQSAALNKAANSAHPSLATPISLKPKRPAFAWEDRRLAGVSLTSGNGREPGTRYAVFEFTMSRQQTLVKEGETLEGGVRVVRIELERVVVEADGEMKVLEVLLSPQEHGRGPTIRSPWVALFTK